MSISNNSRRLCDWSQAELAQWCQTVGEASYRADQIFRWVFAHGVADFLAMKDLPQQLRARLNESFCLFSSRVAQHQISRDRTEKLLLELDDSQVVECVLMREEERRTVCLSTQVGCAMGCSFCASGIGGLKRNLSRGEIIEQALHLQRLLDTGERITNVVVMGMGEPLANLRELLPALEVMQDPKGMALGARRITVSTVGLPDKIRELADVGYAYNLAVSLHAPNDRLRNEIVPVNTNIGIAAILAAADDYFQKTGRRVSYEYVLLAGINDGPEHARQLAALLRDRTAHVNLIPMNPVQSLRVSVSKAARTEEFAEVLRRSNVTVTVRKRKGADIDAACGQLRLRHSATAVNNS